MYNDYGFNMGWVCPKCGRVYSPTTPMCSYCGGNITTIGNGSTGNPVKFEPVSTCSSGCSNTSGNSTVTACNSTASASKSNHKTAPVQRVKAEPARLEDLDLAKLIEDMLGGFEKGSKNPKMPF